VRLADGTNAAARLRKAVDKAGFGVCVKCGREFPASGVDVDHRLALALGGKDIDANVQVLCKPHHVEKTREDRRRMR
jgi:5-methylcytosine-specific restriction protein A